MPIVLDLLRNDYVWFLNVIERQSKRLSVCDCFVNKNDKEQWDI